MSIPVAVHGGINAISDLDLTTSNEVSFLANVFLRGGQMRAIKAPKVHPEVVVPPGSNQVFAYRGRKLFSAKRRSYVAQYRNDREIVTWTEYGGPAKKMVEGVTVALGQVRCRYSPVVESTTAIVPLNVKATSLAGGSLPAGTHYMRLAYKTASGTLPPCAEFSCEVDGTGRLIAITWTTPDTDEVIIGVDLFAGTETEKARFVCTIDPALTRYNLSSYENPINELASDYDQSYGYQYCYTLLRNVMGEEDESGPSAVTDLITSQSGRKVSFDPWLDGTLDSPNLLSIEGTGVSYSFVTLDGYPGAKPSNPLGVTSITAEAGTGRYLIKFAAQHPFLDGDRIFVKDGPTTYLGVPIEILHTDDPTVVAFIPVDAITAPGAVAWTAYRSTEVHLTSCRWNQETGCLEFKTLEEHSFSAGAKVTFLNMLDAAWNNSEVEVLISIDDPKMFFVAGRTIPSDAHLTSGTEQSWGNQVAKQSLTVLQFETMPGIGLPSVGDIVYIDTNETPSLQTTLKLVGAVTQTGFIVEGTTSTPHASNPYPAGPGDYALGLCWIPKNDYVTARRLYRTGGTTEWRLVSEIPLEKLSFTDATTDDSLGDVLPTWVTEDGVSYVYEEPPSGLQGLILHNRMGFAIEPASNRVRVTPVGTLDAWPASFFWSFSTRPMALVSFDQACIVLCEDGIYRMDGDAPTRLRLNKTRAKLGCRAGGSAQVIDNRLVYLSEQGLTMFDGQDAVCFTDLKIPEDFWRGRSRYLQGQTPALPLIPVAQDAAFQRLRGRDIPAMAPPCLMPFLAADRASECLRSFVRDNRYYLYWGGDDPDCEAQTMIYVDFADSRHPIGTIGLKLVDAFVDEKNKIHSIIRQDSGNSTPK